MGDVVTFLLENSELPIGAVVGLLLLWGVVHYAIPLIRKRGDSGEAPAAEAGDHGRVQQTKVGHIKAGGDVNVRPEQK